MKVTLSELLVRRKELKARCDLFQKLAKQRIFEPNIQRRMVSDAQGIEQVDGIVPKTTREAVEVQADYYSKNWRLADQQIQQANHTTVMKVPVTVMKEFVTGEVLPTGEVEETLAALLSRRKTLQQKVVEAWNNIDLANFMTTISTRKKITEGIEDLVNQEKVAPHHLAAKQLFYVKNFRLCEAAISRVNAQTMLDVRDELFQDFE